MFYKKIPLFTKFRFINPYAEKGKIFGFSSDLEKIGMENDVAIANGSYIDIISDPITVNRAKYGGDLSVIRVRADVAIDYHTIIKELWIPIQFIYTLENNDSQSSEFSN